MSVAVPVGGAVCTVLQPLQENYGKATAGPILEEYVF